VGHCSAILHMHGDLVGVDGMTVLTSAGVVECVVASYTYYAMPGFLFGFAVRTDCWGNGG